MSDILLVGLKPGSNEGKEFFLHCADYWFDIVEVLGALTNETFPLENYMHQDSALAPPTPQLGAYAAFIVALQIDRITRDGSARAHLEHYYRTGPFPVDYFEGDEELIAATVAERLEQLDKLARFLKSSGGCRAKWSYEDA
jgi:hypothetical protein